MPGWFDIAGLTRLQNGDEDEKGMLSTVSRGMYYLQPSKANGVLEYIEFPDNCSAITLYGLIDMFR